MQTLAEKFTLAAKIETEGLEWECRMIMTYCFPTVWTKPARELYAAMAPQYEIRIKSLELAQDPHVRPLHNPDGLTGEQIGKGYRLLLHGEVEGENINNANLWISNRWSEPRNDPYNLRYTYRVPIATCPWPAPAWTPKYKKAAHAEGGNARIAPWTLPPPPYGMQWHRQDWTEEMLPEGWRPALEREACAEGDIVRYTMGNEDLADGLIGHAPPKGSWTFRTRRPLPSPPKMIPLGPEDVPPGSALRHPEEPGWVMVWSVCKEKVWTSATSTYTFDFLQEDKWQIKRPNGEWEKCEKLG